MSFRLLLIQFYFKYNFSILTRKYSSFLSIKTVDLQNRNSRLSSMKIFKIIFFKKTLQSEFWEKFCYWIQWNCLKLFNLKRISDFEMRSTMRPNLFLILKIILLRSVFALKFSVFCVIKLTILDRFWMN